jgi:hypothetical protein
MALRRIGRGERSFAATFFDTKWTMWVPLPTGSDSPCLAAPDGRLVAAEPYAAFFRALFASAPLLPIAVAPVLFFAAAQRFWSAAMILALPSALNLGFCFDFLVADVEGAVSFRNFAQRSVCACVIRRRAAALIFRLRGPVVCISGAVDNVLSPFNMARSSAIC